MKPNDFGSPPLILGWCSELWAEPMSNNLVRNCLYVAETHEQASRSTYALTVCLHVEIWPANRLHYIQHTSLHLTPPWHVKKAHWPWFSVLLKHEFQELHELPVIGSGKLAQSFSKSAHHPLWHISVLIYHANLAASVWIPHSQAPTTKPWESRWPNKPRPHLMRSDSPHCRGRGLGFPPSVPLGLSSAQRVTQPSGCPMAAGGQLRESWIHLLLFFWCFFGMLELAAAGWVAGKKKYI